MKLRVRLITEILGTQPGNDELFETYIKSKAPESVKDEETLGFDPDKEIEKGTTVFRRNQHGMLCLCDYQIKGHLKEVGDVIRARLNETKGNKKDKSGWESWKQKVNRNVHIFPRLIPIGKMQPDSILTRPLRAMTMQGERVSLARSEQVGPGTEFIIEVITRGQITEAQILECFDEGRFYGLGQWRNAGFGRYEYELISGAPS